MGGAGILGAVMPKRLSSDTSAIIAAIEHATGAAAIVAERVSQELSEHTKHDDERFTHLTQLTESIATDTKSLLASRSFMRGAWKTLVGMALTVSAGTGLVFTFLQYLRGH